jgi:hypothetical protein
MGGADPMRRFCDHLERHLLDELDAKARGIVDENNLIVIDMENDGGN